MDGSVWLLLSKSVPQSGACARRRHCSNRITSPIQKHRASPDTHRPLVRRCADYLSEPGGWRSGLRDGGLPTDHHAHNKQHVIFYVHFRTFISRLRFLKYLSKESVTQTGWIGHFLVMTMTLEDDLASAAARGNTERVEDLLRRGVDVNGLNCFGRTPLQVSVGVQIKSPTNQMASCFAIYVMDTL